VKAVSVDNPPGDVTVLDVTLGGIGGLDSLLCARAFASGGTPCKLAVVLHIKIEFNILNNRG
jgi:hypothetical protein